jgi:hypothetical protein
MACCSCSKGNDVRNSGDRTFQLLKSVAMEVLSCISAGLQSQIGPPSSPGCCVMNTSPSQ